MPIHHKFLSSSWNNGNDCYETESAILKTTPYEPEVLFIGTYNPNTNGNHNQANFFYGRDNYLFPMLHGIFNLQTIYSQNPPYTNIIWPLCNKLKLCFADLITTIFPNVVVPLIPNTNKVNFGGTTYNLLKDNHLIDLDTIHNQVVWNEEAIIRFINGTASLKYVFLTQKSNNTFRQKFEYITNSCVRSGLTFRCIYTPTGQSLSGVPRELFLAFQWVIEQTDNSGINLSLLHQHNVHSFTYQRYILNF